MLVGDNFGSTGYAFAFQKFSTLEALFSRAVFYLRNTGAIDALYAKWWTVNGVCPSPYAAATGATSTSTFKPITIDDVAGVFILMGVFAAVGGLILLLEIYCHRQRHRPEAVFQVRGLSPRGSSRSFGVFYLGSV